MRSVVVGAGASCEDEVSVFSSDGAVVIMLADGAGGSGGGGVAARGLIDRAKQQRPVPEDEASCASFLERADSDLARSGGETTGVLVVVRNGRAYGASVGDSGAWLIAGPGRREDLTGGQARKPLIGSGEATPVTFSGNLEGKTLLVATDGILKYAPWRDLSTLAASVDLTQASDAIVARVRLRNGDLQDDIGLVLARTAPSP